MRATTLLCLSMALFLTGNAQQRFISADYTRYFDWFHERAQTELLFTPQAALYIFEYETPLRQEPCSDGEVISYLSIGQEVKNLLPAALEAPPNEDRIKGYDDIWWPVAAVNPKGESIQGYVWGGFLAKGWRFFDLGQDGQPEFIMLGVSSRPRENLTTIQAEIRILRGTQLLAQVQVPGLCVFEECASSVLLRILSDQPIKGRQVIEASTLTVGCEVSIEKNYFFWDGVLLKKVMRGEFAFQPFHEVENFTTEREPRGNGTFEIQQCKYAGEDENFNPLWECKTIISKDQISFPVKVK